MKIKLTVLAFFISMLLTGQVLAFDVDGLSYSVIGATNDVRAIGCAADPCSSSDIVIPGTIVDSGITYSVKRIGTGAFSNNAHTSATFEGRFGTFSLYMFPLNPALATIIYCDDNDGGADVGDYCALTANPQQEDADGDLVGDACDNCLVTSNSSQEDANGHGALCTSVGC